MCFIISDVALTQSEVRTNNFLGLGFSYGIDLPFGDMSDRFGQSFHAGLSLDIYNTKLRGSYGVEGYFQFGNKVQEDIFQPLRTESGRIIGNNGQLSEVFARQRGASIGIYINKIILGNKNNPHAGLSGFLGAGIMAHHIRVQDDLGNAGQFFGDYTKGYDRYTRGPYLKQGIEYLNIGKSRSINYSVSIFVTEGFTKGKRAINFDNRFVDNESRLDIMVGLNLKWYLPIFNVGFSSKSEVFY